MVDSGSPASQVDAPKLEPSVTGTAAAAAGLGVRADPSRESCRPQGQRTIFWKVIEVLNNLLITRGVLVHHNLLWC
jgi:hypothetical protein